MSTLITREDDEEPERSAEASEQEVYKVGPGKPPLHSRFQPKNKFGKGRKKGSKGLKTIVREALEMKRSVRLDNKVQKVSKIELTIHQVANKASEGDPKAGDRAIDLYARYGPEEGGDEPEAEKLKRDWRALKDYLEMKEFLCPDEEEDDE